MSAALLVRLILWSWFAAAAYAGHALVLQRIAAPAIPALGLMAAALLFMTYTRSALLRDWVDGINLRALVLLHLSRLLGIAYLVLHARGQLSSAFALSAGIGDIALAAFALPVALAPLDDAGRARAISAWNIAGLTSSLIVLGGMVRLGFTDPFQLAAFAQLPLCLLPTFFLPLLLATHLLIFARLSRSE